MRAFNHQVTTTATTCNRLLITRKCFSFSFFLFSLTSWRKHARAAVVNAYYNALENSIEVSIVISVKW